MDRTRRTRQRGARVQPRSRQGHVYVGFTNVAAGQTGGAVAIDASNGRILWTRMLPLSNPSIASGGYAGVALTNELVVAPTYDGYVRGVDRATGEVRKTLPPTAFVGPSETPHDLEMRTVSGVPGLALIGSEYGWLTALAGADLHKVWMTNAKRGTPLDIAADGELVCSSYFWQFAVSRLSDGATLWGVDRYSLRPDGAELNSNAGGSDGNSIYVGGDHEIYAFKKHY